MSRFVKKKQVINRPLLEKSRFTFRYRILRYSLHNNDIIKFKVRTTTGLYP